MSRNYHFIEDEWEQPETKKFPELVAGGKSYTMHAMLTLVLYLFLFIPGLIANTMFYNEGERMERIAGHALPGVGMLRLMRQIVFVLLVLGVFAGIVFAIILYRGV